MDVSHILDGLNDAQREAVAAPTQNLLVLAGAGSGKTRVLVHRIAWLMQMEGFSPNSIMAVTFTNKAAREMRGRIEELLHIPGRGMWFGTFHGIAHRFLRAHYREAKLPENFQILDSDDQLRIIKRLMRERGIDEARIPPRQVQGFINSRKDEGVRAKHLPAAKNPFDKQLHGLYLDYEDQCNLSGLVDFGELLLRSHEIWLNNPALLAHYQDRFSYLLVDEFQDTNTVQYAWLRVLAGDRIPVMVVGDDDQSIYGWRGAKVENIRQFESDFANAHTVRLEQNYRSTANILNAANAVISNNGGRLGKQLWTDGADGELIDLYAGFNEQDEANYIADRIATWVEQGNMRQEVAILYRSNAQSRTLEESLIRSNIPYRIYGGHRFFDRMEIRNAMAYLRLVYFQHDDAAFERVVNVPARGLGPKKIEQIRQQARDAGSTLWQASAKLIEQDAIKGKAKAELAKFMDFIEVLSTQVHELSLGTLTDTVVKDTGLMAMHAKETGEKGQAQKENLEELIGAAQDYEAEDDEQPELAQFIAQAALDAGEQQAAEHEDSVQMMTLHSAKGLEFPLVFMPGMEENLFPHSMSSEEPGRLEEERRLAYVGITRARKKLVLTYAEARRLYGDTKYNPLSRFVREIPSTTIQEVRIRNTVSRPVSFGGSSGLGTSLSDSANETQEFQLGDLVSHPKFGEGTVVHYEGRGPHARVQIMFQEHGNKWLVLSYAKLSKV